MERIRAVGGELRRLAARCLVLAMVAMVTIACGDADAMKVTDRFLGALKAEDYRAAHAELHSGARESVPDADALRRLVEGSGRRITEWSRTCSAWTDDMDRGGYNFGSDVTGDRKDPVTIGVAPKNLGKCKGPLLIELRREDGAWKVWTLRY